MSRQSTTIPHPEGVPEPQPQFSQVNMFTFQPGDKLVAITGQLAIQPNPSDPVPTDFEDQVRLALKNLENCLKAAGATKRDIFKVTHHVVDFDPEKQNPAKVFCEWLGSDFRPASAMLPAFRLAGPGLMYEIETWAIVPAK